MSHLTLTERLDEMRQKYIDERTGNHLESLGSCNDLRQLKKVKKKLLALEKERCQLLIEKKDITAITQKITHLKTLYMAKNNSKGQS